MRAEDIIVQLAVRLPQLTDKLTRDVPLNSLTRSGTVMTAACAAEHGLSPGDGVAITGAIAPISITSLTRSATTGTLVTSTDHDRTLNLTRVLATDLGKTVTTSGAVESEFNGTFTIIRVVNRRKIEFTMADSGPTTATGSPVLEDGESALRDYNTTYAVLEAPDAATFTFTQTTTSLPDPIGTIVARAKPRISTAVTPDRLVQAYTEKGIDELWLFVVLEDVPASKSRAVLSDAIDNLQRGNEFRQQIIQPFTLYLFIPTSANISGRPARDLAEDLFQPICQSVLFGKFDSGLFVGKQGPVQFSTHGTFSYDTAVYVHAYSFQQVVDLVFEDTVGSDLDVAFRDIDLTIFPDLDGGTGLANLTATIDLDEEAV